MQSVILKDNISKLGKVGDEVKVKGGYARNYLIPSGKAVRATEENRVEIAKIKAEIEAQIAKRVAAAEKVKEAFVALPALSVTHQLKADGTLFGSVSATEIAEAIAGVGGDIAAKQIDLSGHIKMPGEHTFTVRFEEEVTATGTITVEAEAVFDEDEASHDQPADEDSAETNE